MKKKMSLLIIALILAVGISGCKSNLDEAYERATEERKKSVPEVTEVITSEETEVSASEETEVSASEETEVIASEETEVSASEKTEVIASEKTEVIASEKTEVIASEETEVIASEETEVIASEEAIIPEEGLELRPFGFIGAENIKIKVTQEECWLYKGAEAKLVARGNFLTAEVVREESSPDYGGITIKFESEIESYEQGVNWIIFQSRVNATNVDIRNKEMKLLDETGIYWTCKGVNKVKLYKDDLVQVWTSQPETIQDYSGLRWVTVYTTNEERGEETRRKELR